MMEDISMVAVLPPARDMRVIDNQIINTSGATADIIRQTFHSGETAILKRAKSPAFNTGLQNEFRVLSYLRGVSHAIPIVYEELPPKGSVLEYAFQEEDLGEYKPLFDRSRKDKP